MSPPRRYASNAERQRAYRERCKTRRRRSVEWYTPTEWFEWFDQRYGPLNVDPCASPESPVWPLVAGHLTRDQDGLRSSWAVPLQASLVGSAEVTSARRAFVNPPYGRGLIAPWVERCAGAVAAGEVELAAMLVPLRPSSAWFRRALEHGATYEPLPRRVRFWEPQPDGTLARSQGALFECTAVVFRNARPVTNRRARGAR